MAQALQAIRGMNDILPGEVVCWQRLEATIRQLMRRYAYQEIRLPIVEHTALFKRSVGELTDIIEKETYTFTDRNGDSLTLRPEGTAVCVRAAIQHGLLNNQAQRLWYLGPMFRHERPQKGRYRQFHQLGVETFGLADADIDAELLVMQARLWRELGIADNVRLEINCLGSLAARKAYRDILIDYFTEHKDQLDADSLRRLQDNPLRILDSKNPAMQAINAAAPSILEHLDDESKQHFASLCELLQHSGLSYTINPRLVRGLDYYTGTVFEWITCDLGAQGTIAAGGRYDVLVEQLGGKPTPALGFAMGLERIILLLSQQKQVNVAQIDAYFIHVGELAQQHALPLAEKLRDALPHLRLQMHATGGSFKSQMKKADKSGASIALILGDDEAKDARVSVKYLREAREQESVPMKELANFLAQELTQEKVEVW